MTATAPVKVFIATDGIEYTQIWQLLPWLEKYYTSFEKNFNPLPTQAWMIENPGLPIVVVCLYLALCFVGTMEMARRSAFILRNKLAVWNLSLSLFSAWGALRTAPHLYYNLVYTSFEATICQTPRSGWGMGATGLAVNLFILSKFPELIDTVFIVLKKRPLIFLHWYHHVTVLLYCWHAYVTESSSALYFVVMNYSVHAVMYFYYFLQTVKLVPKWFPSWIITVFQISQMFVGVYITFMAIYYYNYGGQQFPKYTCSNDISNMIAASLMYASYAALFIVFALERFLFPSKKQISPSKKK